MLKLLNIDFNKQSMPTRLVMEPVQSIDSICGVHGAYIGEVFRFTNQDRVSGCPKCLEEGYQKQAVSDLAKTRKLLQESNARRLFRQSMLPEKYLTATFNSYKPICDESRYVLKVIQNYSRNFEQLQKKGTSLIFHGNPGTGKTFLSCATAKHIQEHFTSKKVLYCTYGQMIDSIRQAYSDSTISKTDRIQSFIEPDLLIIDEIGIANETTDEYVLFNRVMDGRYLATAKPVILISNYSIEQVNSKLGAAVMDRLRESCSFPLGFSWEESYRKNIADENRNEVCDLLGI
ncbi:MAG: ATP-binding protein [bacterium]|nr:ATP-binding protein [bacterium]